VSAAGERAAAAALSAVGARFRLHGRAVETGLDCVGLVAVALRAGGCGVAVPTGYALRGGDPARVTAWLDAVLVRCDDAAVGDVVVLRAGPGQLHFAVRCDGGVVHADAGLRRVVMRPGAGGYDLGTVLGCWRIGEG